MGADNQPDSITNKRPEAIANKIKELHSNVRHITQLAMNWFAFFVTVNYLTMGWLAKRPSSAAESIDPNIIKVLALVFIVQNLLVTVGLFWVLIAAATMKRQVDEVESPRPDENVGTQKGTPKSYSILLGLYRGIGASLMFVLLSLAGAWAMIL